MTSTALTSAHTLDLGQEIHTPAEFANRIRALSAQAHIVSPITAVAAIPACYAIVPALVVIDPTSRDVYAGSFHKKEKDRGGTWHPIEVSLSKTGLLKIMAAAGINLTRSSRTDDGKTPYYWAWQSEGTVMEFSTIRQLPPGTAEVDLRDGSAQVGEWTPEKWAEREAAAEVERQKTPEKDRWKVKPEPIGGWSRERLMQARSKGLRICESLSLNALIRNLGLPQKFTVEELRKPFVVFKTVYQPDMSQPGVAAIVTAAHFGALHLLYPQALPPGTPLALAPPTVTPAEDEDEHDDEAITTATSTLAATVGVTAPAGPPVTSAAAALPAGAVEIDDIPEPAATAPAPVAHRLVKASLLDGRYFFDSDRGATFITDDVAVARALNEARKAGRVLEIDSENEAVAGVVYRRVLEARPAVAAALPSTKEL